MPLSTAASPLTPGLHSLLDWQVRLFSAVVNVLKSY